ncbi:hypothetical protein NFI96_016365 [Prochilodus magdalenae]|nr:hypothetical protein NFI96_016365 [Prochilodus magdalenae]
MASVERKRNKQEPFYLSHVTKRQTSAEIVTEARRSLRILGTQRPFTPRDELRQLFGDTSVRTRDRRPPSSFSLHARHFETSDSRPSSGTRLSPLEHKPKLPLSLDEDCTEGGTAVPKPPVDRLERRGSGGARTRHIRAQSLTRLPPMTPNSKGMTLRSAAFVGVGTGPCHVASRRGGSVSEKTVQHMCDACATLHDALAEKNMLGRRFKKRSSILRALFRLIDLRSDQLNLTLAKLILALDVRGNNLLNICKLVFKISQSPSNDVLFQNSSVIDSLLSLLQCEQVHSSGEILLYTVGSLKLLSGNCALSRMLLAKDFIGVLLQLAQRLTQLATPNAPPDTDHTGQGQHVIAGHILVQLTAALRNMADLSESRSSFLSNCVFSTLCTVMDHHQDDQDICLNIARIFSKLSSYAGCCYALAETLCCYRLFLDLLSKHSRKQDLVVRLLFTLGNLAARSNEARESLYEQEGAIDILLSLFQNYQPAAVAPNSLQDSQGPLHQNEDVLVKLIRVLANLSIHPAVGTVLAANTLCVQLLLEVMEVRSVEDSTELVVNASATINNLSYYQEENSVVRAQHTHISDLMLRLLLSSNMDAVLEATRVFGNLSQIKDVRLFIVKNKVHQFVVTLLDSKSPDVCFSACGVLMNLSVDPENRSKLSKEGAIPKLIDCLRDFGPQDWQLAGLVCQTLWNCIEEGEKQSMQELLEILCLYSDQTCLQWPPSDDVREYQESCWELDFLPVAQKLKKRIQSHVTLLKPIDGPPEQPFDHT